MFTVAVVEDEADAARRLEACLARYSRDHPGVRFDVTVFSEPTRLLEGYRPVWDVEDKLGDRGFLRCSKAFVVNGRHVVAVKGNELTLSGGENVTIGRAYRKAFMVALAASMGDGNVM